VTKKTNAPDLSAAAREARYDAERLQGEVIAAGEEAAWGWGTPAGRIRAERRAAFLTQAAALGSGVTCVELGAGTGEFTVRLAETGSRVIAIELSETTADVCRTRVGDRAEVVVGNIETGEGLGYLDGVEVDAIVGVSVLHHVNLDLTFENTFSRLRRGGRFAFSEPNMANPQIWLERHVDLVKRWRHVTPHETAFKVVELRRAFEAAGLVVDTCEPFEFLHPATPRALLGAVTAIESVVERSPIRSVAGSLRIAGHRP
jgi:SAM-dependent methyltransferase